MKLSELKCISDNIDLDQYIYYREEIKSTMEHPDWLGDFSKEDLIFMLKNGSKIFNYYDDSNFVCSMMLIPGDEKNCKKFGLDIDSNKVVDYGPMFVNPKYRGNSLQYQMLLEIDKLVISFGYKYAAATIHPDNIYSIHNLLKDDFVIIGTKTFKRGIRNLYLKNLIPVNKKILSFIVCENKLLLLKGSDSDPQFHSSFWYVVTGSCEDVDSSLEDTVRREILEETNIIVDEVKSIPLVFEYFSLGDLCLEFSHISYVSGKISNLEIILNEESIDYKWCDLDEFIDLINWFSDKNELKEILSNILED